MKIYVAKNGGRLGPYTLDEAQNLRASGQILGTDLAWYEGQANWIPLSQVPGMFSSTLSSAAPPPPPAPEGDSKLLFKRLATTFVIFIVCFVFFFVVIFFLAMMIGGAISGFEASVSAPKAQGFSDGYKLGHDAGHNFAKAYSGIIAALSALASLVISGAGSLWIAFSGWLPWCRDSRKF